MTTMELIRKVKEMKEADKLDNRNLKFQICILYQNDEINSNQYLYIIEMIDAGEFDDTVGEIMAEENTLENPVECVSIYWQDGNHIIDGYFSEIIESLKDRHVRYYNRESDGTLNLFIKGEY